MFANTSPVFAMKIVEVGELHRLVRHLMVKYLMIYPLLLLLEC
jgi:hypothetical protein